MAPPTHKYFGCENNTQQLAQTEALFDISTMKSDTSVLKLLKIWSHDDSNAFLKEPYRFTSEGLDKYWAAVDSAICYWNTAIHPKLLHHHWKN